MSRADRLWMLLGFAALLLVLLWQGMERRRVAEAMVPLAVAEKANERSAKLEAKVESLEREVQTLRDQAQARIDMMEARTLSLEKVQGQLVARTEGD